jgi:hypothetical protein
MRLIRARLFVIAAIALQGVLVDRLCAVQFGAGGLSVRVSETSFDKGSFGQLTVIAARKKAEDSLQAYLTLIDKAAGLTKAQRSKLDLAGQIDIHRFFSDYASAKRAMTFGIVPRNDLQATLVRMRKVALPMVSRYASGLHVESSLLAKMLATTLEEDQRASVTEMLRERKKLIYANHIRMTLAMIDHRIPLTEKERSTITTLLLSRTDPPESYGASTTSPFQVLARMGQIEDALRELFSDEEELVISEMIRVGIAVAQNQ